MCAIELKQVPFELRLFIRTSVRRSFASALHSPTEGDRQGMGTILLILLILLLIGAFPTWPHSRSWGYYPSGGLGLVLIIVLILVLMGRL
jgi:hypothetical protein